MPPFYRIAEASLYALLNFLPYILIALYPFRRHLRFSRSVTALCIGTVTALQIVLGNLSAFSPIDAGLLSAISTAIYAAFYFLVIKAHVGKALFVLLMVSNVANLIVSAAKCIEGYICIANALQSYRWSFSLILLGLQLICLIPLHFYIQKTFSVVTEKPGSRPLWRYIWLIPATFYFIWFYHLYAWGRGSSLEMALSPANTVFLLVINACALLIYHVTFRLLDFMEKNESLADHNHQLVMQNLQYENLHTRIAEARQAKHDVRHHVTVLDSYAESGDLAGLRNYLAAYKRSLPDDSQIVYCPHRAVNTVLLYFAQQAKSNGIDYGVALADVPERLPIADNVLSVVLGNLLENAIEACANVTDRTPSIQIKIKYERSALLIHIENTYAGELLQNKNGYYLSSKHEGRGLGLRSVRHIIAQHEGLLDITQRDQVFFVDVFLNANEDTGKT